MEDMVEERTHISNGYAPLAWTKRVPTAQEVIDLLRLGRTEPDFVKKLGRAIERADEIRGGTRFSDLHKHLADALHCPPSCPRITNCPLKAA